MEIGTLPSFIFPPRPEDAVLRLVIDVVPSGMGSFTFDAGLVPDVDRRHRGDDLSLEAIQAIFRTAKVVPRVGRYIVEQSQDGTLVTIAPDGTDEQDERALSWVCEERLTGLHVELVSDLRKFPPVEVITDAARKVASAISLGSMERTMLLDATPVIDARTVAVEGMEWGRRGRGRESGMKVAVVDRDGVPVLLVGYLTHDNEFSGALNAELARRITAAVEEVAVEVMTELLVKNEASRRMSERLMAAVRATYTEIDPATIVQQVDAFEAETRAALAPPADEDTGTGSDNGIDEVDTDSDGNGTDGTDSDSEEPAGEPVPDTTAQVDEPAPVG